MFFFHDTPTPHIYTLSLHDALPIFLTASKQFRHGATSKSRSNTASNSTKHKSPHLSEVIYVWCYCWRSEERFSRNAETDLVCRLLLEKKKREKKISSKSIERIRKII